MVKEKNKDICEMSRQDLESYVRELENDKEGIIKEAETLGRLARDQESWINETKGKYRKLLALLKRQNVEIEKYRWTIPILKNKIDRSVPQLQCLDNIYQQFKVHGGLAIASNFSHQVGFSQNVVKIIILAERKRILGRSESQDSPESSQEFNSVDIDISVDESSK